MTNPTRCLTPDAIFKFRIKSRFPSEKSPLTTVGMEVELPFFLDLTEEQAEELETLLHNQFELVLSRYFNK